MKRTWIGMIGLAVTLTWISSAAAEPQGVQAFRNLPYVANGHERQRLDIYLPEKATGRLPLVVWIHGGGWEGRQQRQLRRRAAGRPRATPWPAINYRLSQHALFPAQIEDCKAAIRWLRANAAKYHIDPDHVGVWGRFGRRPPGRPAGHHRRREGVRGQRRQPRPVQPRPVRRRFLRPDRMADDGPAGQ